MAKLPTVDPAPPPVAERPKCPWCQKPLRPRLEVAFKRVESGGGFHMEPERRRWTGRYHGYEAFCALRCCREFANAAYRGGYRTKGEK